MTPSRKKRENVFNTCNKGLGCKISKEQLINKKPQKLSKELNRQFTQKEIQINEKVVSSIIFQGNAN